MDKNRERLKGIGNSVNILSLHQIVYCVHAIDAANAIEVSACQQSGL